MSLDPGSGSGSPMSERMQALLSRAVEDQVNEQRQVQNLVGEVRNHLAQLAAQVDALRASPPGATDQLERAVAGVSGEIREAIRVLGERIDGVSALVHQRGQDLADLRGIVDSEVRPRVDALDGTLREMRSAFTGVAARVADLPGRADVEAMVGRAGDSGAEVPERLDRVEGTLAELHDGVLGEDGLHARLAAMSNQGPDPDLAGTVAEAVAQTVNTTVDQAVARAVADSERRLSNHIDEAVLALAEALLRRRTAGSGRAPASPFDTGEFQAISADFTAATSGSVERAAPASTPSPTAEAPGAAEPAAPVAPPEPPEPEPPAEVHLDAEPNREPAHVAAPADHGLRDALEDDDEGRKRRPWWRPSD
jgi:hypothetical protein